MRLVLFSILFASVPVFGMSAESEQCYLLMAEVSHIEIVPPTEFQEAQERLKDIATHRGQSLKHTPLRHETREALNTFYLENKALLTAHDPLLIALRNGHATHEEGSDFAGAGKLVSVGIDVLKLAEATEEERDAVRALLVSDTIHELRLIVPGKPVDLSQFPAQLTDFLGDAASHVTSIRIDCPELNALLEAGTEFQWESDAATDPKIYGDRMERATGVHTAKQILDRISKSDSWEPPSVWPPAPVMHFNLVEKMHLMMCFRAYAENVTATVPAMFALGSVRTINMEDAYYNPRLGVMIGEACKQSGQPESSWPQIWN